MPDPQTQTPTPGSLSIEDLASRIKAKHPEYQSVEPTELVNRVVAKHPEYQGYLKPPQVNPAAPTQVSAARSADESIPATLEELSGNISRDVSSGLTKAWTGKTPDQLPPWAQHVTGLLTGIPAGAAASIPGMLGAAGRLYQAGVTDKTAGALGRHAARAGAEGIENYFGMIGPGAIVGGLAGGAAKKTLATLGGYAALQPLAHEAAQKLPVAQEYRDLTEQTAALLGGVGAERGLHAAVEARNRAGYQSVRNQVAGTFNQGIAKGLTERGEALRDRPGVTTQARSAPPSVTNQSQPAALDTARQIEPEPLKSATPAPQLPAKPIGPELASTSIAPHVNDPTWDKATQQHNEAFAKLATPAAATPPQASAPTQVAGQPREARAADTTRNRVNELMQPPEPRVAQGRVSKSASPALTPEYAQFDAEYDKAAAAQRKIAGVLERDRKAEPDSRDKLTDAAREKLVDAHDKARQATTEAFDRKVGVLKNPESVKLVADQHLSELERLQRTRNFLADTLAHEPEVARVRSEIDQTFDPAKRIALHESVGDKLSPAFKPLQGHESGEIANKQPRVFSQEVIDQMRVGDPETMRGAAQQQFKDNAQDLRNRVDAAKTEMRRQIAELPEGSERRAVLQNLLDNHGEKTVFLPRTVPNNNPSMGFAAHEDGATLRGQLAATTDPAMRERLQTQLGDWERAIKVDGSGRITDFGNSKYKQFNFRTADAIWRENGWSRSTGRKELKLDALAVERPVRIAQLDQQIAQRQQELMRLKKRQPSVAVPDFAAAPKTVEVKPEAAPASTAIVPAPKPVSEPRGEALLQLMRERFPKETPRVLRERLTHAIEIKLTGLGYDIERAPKEVRDRIFNELKEQLEGLALSARPTPVVPERAEAAALTPGVEALEFLRAQAAKLKGRNYQTLVDLMSEDAVSPALEERALRHAIKTGKFTEASKIAKGLQTEKDFDSSGFLKSEAGGVRIGKDLTPEAILERAVNAGVSAYRVTSQRPAESSGWLSSNGEHFLSVGKNPGYDTHEQILSKLFPEETWRPGYAQRMLDTGWVRKSGAGIYEFRSLNSPTTYVTLSNAIRQDLPHLMRDGKDGFIALEWTQPNGDPANALFKTSAFLNDYGMDLRRAIKATQAQNYILGSGMGGLQQWFDSRQRDSQSKHSFTRDVISEQIEASGRTAPFQQQLKSALLHVGDVVHQAFATSVAPLLRAERKAGKALEKQGVAKPDVLPSQILTTAYNSIEGAKAVDAQRFSETFSKAVKDIDLPDAADAIKQYLALRRGQDNIQEWERKAAEGDENAQRVLQDKVLPPGLNDKAEIQNKLLTLGREVGVEKFTKLVEHGDALRQQMSAVALEEMHAAGFINEKSYAKWKSDDRFYIPNNRFFPGVVDRSDPFLTSLANKSQRALVETDGSRKWITDPIHAMQDLMAESREVAQQNRTNRSIVKAMQQFGEGFELQTLKPKQRVPEGHTEFHVWEDGKPQRYSLPKALAETLRFVTPADMGWMEKSLSFPAKLLRYGVTVGYSSFAVPATIGHHISAALGPAGPNLVNPVESARWIGGYLGALRDIRAKNEGWAEGQRAGVMFNSYWNDIAANLKPSDVPKRLQSTVGKTLGAVEHTQSWFENANRLNSYRRLQAKGYSDADSRYLALRYGGAPDFRAPRGTLVSNINQATLFFKAGLAYADQAHGIITDPKIAPKDRAQAAAKLTVMAAFFGLAMLHNNKFRDEDGTASISHVPEEDRVQNFVWMTDKTEMLPNGHVTHVPVKFKLPATTRYWINAIRLPLEAMFSSDPSDHTIGNLGRKIFDTFSPVHPAIYRGSVSGFAARTAGANLTPGIRVPFETALNMQFHTGGAIVPKSKEKEAPYAQTMPSTSPALEKLTPSWMSPARSEYLLRNLTGGVGGEAIRAGDLLAGPRSSLTPTERLNKVPFAGSLAHRFYGPSSADQVDRDKIDLFYKWKDKATEAKSTYDDYRKNNPAKAAQMLADPKQVRLLSLGSNLAAAERQLSGIRRQEDLVRKSADTGRSPEAVMRTLGQLYNARQRVLDSINATVAAVTK